MRLTSGDEALATDCVQDAFLRLLESEETIDNPRAWLFKVATHAVYDWTGKARRREDLMRENPGQAPTPETTETPEAVLERSERIRMVRDALSDLAETDRTVLLMREEGFKHREIAEAVGTTTGSVGTMIARALDRLAQKLPLDAGVVG